MKNKVCAFCNKEFIDISKNGRRKYCGKVCADKAAIEKKKQNNLKNPNRVKRWYKTWFDKNREKIRLSHKEYYKENKDKIRERAHAYELSHKEEKRLYGIKYYQEHPEKLEEKRLKQKEYVKKNKDKLKQYSKIHHDNNKFDGNREKALKRDNSICQICNSNKNLVIHHKSKSNKLNKLVTLCRDCHHTIHGFTRMYKRINGKDITYEEIITKLF